MRCVQKKIWFFIFIIVVLIALCVAFSASGTKMKRITIVFNNATVSADVANTSADQKRGLSGRTKLGTGDGMWFAFPSDVGYGFWMNEMNFSLDMIWFDKDFKIIFIKENATPESYPEVFGPKIPYRFVLEVPSGFVQKNSISVGDVVSVK